MEGNRWRVDDFECVGIVLCVGCTWSDLKTSNEEEEGRERAGLVHVDLHLYLGHLAETFFQSDLQ